jgi:hypothetical protein
LQRNKAAYRDIVFVMIRWAPRRIAPPEPLHEGARYR